MQKNVSIDSVFSNKISTCKFKWDNVGMEHSLFFETFYKLDEYSVYTENKLLTDIINKIPNFNSAELLKNNYKLFYKTFALWKVLC